MTGTYDIRGSHSMCKQCIILINQGIIYKDDPQTAPHHIPHKVLNALPIPVRDKCTTIPMLRC